MSAKKLAVLTYPQYLLIAIGALLSFVLVRKLAGVLQTFLSAATACELTYWSRSSTGGLDSASFG